MTVKPIASFTSFSSHNNKEIPVAINIMVDI